MATSHHKSAAVDQDTPITIKVSVNECVKKLKLPLRDLGASVLPGKLRQALGIKPEQHLLLERFSDSAGGYITLDDSNPQVFKTLIRAAKAKLKLRLKATVTPPAIPVTAEEQHIKMEESLAHATNPSRDSTALDQRSVGCGIFQFREARASQQTLVEDEAQVPQAFASRPVSAVGKLAAPVSQPALALRPREPVSTIQPHTHAWSVYCNECDQAMPNEHYHCGICDDGDFDLCQNCVSSGKLCRGEGHWLIKRFIQDGKVVNSVTERLSPRKAESVPLCCVKTWPAVAPEMAEAHTEETRTLTKESSAPSRTCNSCVVSFPENEFVTCTACDDFDLCLDCHTTDKHGHHPAHGFEPATENAVLSLAAEAKLLPGRNVSHNAICDGCDKKIYGVRHKCLNCPDWDYCGKCIDNASICHPTHRFAALYEPIADQGPSAVRHAGIFCDGPLCSKRVSQSYIQGVRYKCTICHDTDFCASCEALPSNTHNRTHPLIKLTFPVRSVNVSTENEDARGNVRVMGDRHQPLISSASRHRHGDAPTKVAATQVQTVAEFTPTEIKKEETRPIQIPVKTSTQQSPVAETAATQSSVASTMLNAHFVRDTIPDGHMLLPGTCFTQVWTLKNPGPYAWPAGCSVRYVGGDNMLNVDNSHPVAVTTIADATESNVVGREVQAGEEVAFKVVLKAPSREGKAISYWRLKAADGVPFGHRLWCDVEVQTPKQAKQPLSGHLPVEQMMVQQLAQQEQLRLQMLAQVPPQLPFDPFADARPSSQQFVPRSEQPPSYDQAARFKAMIEEQKKRREQLIARCNAHSDSIQATQALRHDLRAQACPAVLRHKFMHTLGGDERRGALKQRFDQIRADIMKNREEIQTAAEKRREQQTLTEADDPVQAKGDDNGVTDEVEQENDVRSDSADALTGSQMVFPKLEKESPTSSTYQSATDSAIKGKAAYVENENGEVERSASPTTAQVSEPASPAAEDFVDLDDELEVLSANDADSEDDGFVTDEEYDILDASDSETVASKN